MQLYSDILKRKYQGLHYLHKYWKILRTTIFFTSDLTILNTAAGKIEQDHIQLKDDWSFPSLSAS